VERHLVHNNIDYAPPLSAALLPGVAAFGAGKYNDLILERELAQA
jgi:hypothetical protein